MLHLSLVQWKGTAWFNTAPYEHPQTPREVTFECILKKSGSEENISHIKENGIEPASSAAAEFQMLLECWTPDHITSHKKDKLSMLFCEV